MTRLDSPSHLREYFTSVRVIKGVGDAIAEHLARLLGTSAPTLRDLAFHLPSDVVIRTATKNIVAAPEGQPVALKVKVEEHQASKGKRWGGRSSPYKVWCSDASGHITLVFFNVRGDYLLKQLPVGEERTVCGVFERSAHGWQIVHPDVIAPASKWQEYGGPQALYPLTYGLTQKNLGRMISQALAKLSPLPEWLDEALLAQRRWPGFTQALKQLHSLTGTEILNPHAPPRARLAYDELLASQLALAIVRQHMKKQQSIPLNIKHTLTKALIQSLPFELTQGQRQVLREIAEDMATGERMLRLLQGDVGSGKTLVALLTMLQIVEAGGQAVLMAPTEILARQHLKTLTNLLEPLNISPLLLTGSVKGEARKQALVAVQSGEAKIILGTHALFQEGVEFDALQLVVIDEQHRFGVAQRMQLSQKGQNPHVLLMTATPIPRSLAMTAFGDLDSSILHEKPAGRQPIDTRVIPLSRVDEVLAAIPRATAQGHKVYWICPFVEENEEKLELSDIATAEARYKEFSVRFGARVRMAHGRMKQPAREAAMRDFAGDTADILVATTVVEVGVDVPEATIIVIEHAERFGLAQLHQLRGRVGRGSQPSSCILLYTEPLSENGKARLRTMRETNDGFKIAEEDLRLRGAGEVLGTRQSGVPQFQLANLSEHAELIAMARDDVKLILHNDAELKTARGQALRDLLRLFKHDEKMEYLRS